MRTRNHLRSVSHDLRDLVVDGGAVRPVTTDQQEELWRRITSRAELRWRPPWAVLSAGAGALMLAMLGIWLSGSGTSPVAKPAPSTGARSPAPAKEPALVLPAQARSVRLGSRVALGLWPDAQVTLPATADPDNRGQYRVRLESGRLMAAVAPRAADEPLSVVTPQLSVIVVGTRFSVQVAENVTTVMVEQGRVRVECRQRIVYLSAGDSIRSDDTRLGSPQLAVPCASEPTLRARRLCLSREAEGQGLAAENALVALALLARDQGADAQRALALFREHQRRFPHGPLAPEVARAIADLLARAP